MVITPGNKISKLYVYIVSRSTVIICKRIYCFMMMLTYLSLSKTREKDSNGDEVKTVLQ